MPGPDYDPVSLTFVFELSLLAVLLYVLASDVYIHREKRRTLVILILLVACHNAICYADIASKPWAMAYDQFLKKLESIVTYSLRPVMILMFTSVVRDGRRKTDGLSWTRVGINAAVYLTAFVSPVAFSFYPGGTFRRGPLGYTCPLISGLLMLNLLFFLLRTYRKPKGFSLGIPVMNTVMLMAGVAYDLAMTGGDSRITGLGHALVGNCIFYYLWLHLRFVRAHEDEMRASQRIQMMKTQIQPHFLFNTLNTIRAVYAMDPAQGEQTLAKFSKYLRQNLDAMERTDLIPFSQEMDHTRLYAEIEMLRFPSIRVKYDLQDEGFDLPVLSVQPLVENAIRHGVRSRENGLVTVSTAREAGGHRVTVTDNGVGFDPKQQPSTEELHIGIRNVKERVEKMCGGELILTSEVGEGTSVTMLFPDRSQRESKETGK